MSKDDLIVLWPFLAARRRRGRCDWCGQRSPALNEEFVDRLCRICDDCRGSGATLVDGLYRMPVKEAAP